MKISRRSFLGKAMKSLALVVVAPVLIPRLATKEITANPVPKDKGKKIGFRRYGSKFKCDDFKPYIEVMDYKAGETITYQDLRTDECSMCAKSAGCTETGKRFTKHNPVQHKPFMPEMWGKKLHASLRKEAFLTKLI